MKLEIRNFLGEKIQLEPRLGLYRVSDMMGKRLPVLRFFSTSSPRRDGSRIVR